jgi:hypothetical protein
MYFEIPSALAAGFAIYSEKVDLRRMIAVMRMNKIYLLAAPGFVWAAACIPVAVSVPSVAAEAADETTVNILAARVRQQGFDCAKGKSASLDQKQSRPNETVWVLNCDNSRYRIRLVPDMGSKIEQLKQ